MTLGYNLTGPLPSPEGTRGTCGPVTGFSSAVKSPVHLSRSFVWTPPLMKGPSSYGEPLGDNTCSWKDPVRSIFEDLPPGVGILD